MQRITSNKASNRVINKANLFLIIPLLIVEDIGG